MKAWKDGRARGPKDPGGPVLGGLLRARAVGATLLVAFCGGVPAGGAVPDAASGVAEFVDHERGGLPLILTAPHGGREGPAAFADRKEGKLGGDRNTAELTRAISDELKRRTGRAPHSIISLLQRVKLDPNRDLPEAAQGDPHATRVWQRFQACVDAAKQEAVGAFGFAFLIDVHGHSHPTARIELGYALSGVELNSTDAELDAGSAAQRSSLRHVHARAGQGFARLLRGPRSLGALFEAHGYSVIPSPGVPRPGGDLYNSGSYILRHHTSARFPGVDGIQLECPFPGVRDTPENRARLARALVDAVADFLKIHYGHTLPTAPRASGR